MEDKPFGCDDSVSEILKDRAVVLRTYDFRESSLISVVLTRSHGKVRLLAKGAKRRGSPFFGNLRTGNVCEIVFYFRPERGLQLLKEIESERVFMKADGDLDRLCILQAGLEVINHSVSETETDERMMDLLEHFMDGLEPAADPWLVFYTLEVGLLKITGLFPSTGACGRCGKELQDESFGIEPTSGVVACSSCMGEGMRMLSQSASKLLEGMAREGFGGVEGRRLSREERRELGEILHHIFLNHVDGYRLPRALAMISGERCG